MAKDDRIREAARQHLGAKRVTLWADWDLGQPERFNQAVDWLTAEVMAVLGVERDICDMDPEGAWIDGVQYTWCRTHSNHCEEPA